MEDPTLNIGSITLSGFILLSIPCAVFADTSASHRSSHPQNGALSASAVQDTKIGDQFGSRGQYVQAEKYFREAVRLKPADARCQFGLGQVLYGEGKYAEAEPFLRNAVRFKPKNADYQNFLGCVLSNLDRYPEAELHNGEAVRLAPKNAEFQDSLGDTLVIESKTAEAEKH
jgi:Flp pilus assembly protein TadD